MTTRKPSTHSLIPGLYLDMKMCHNSFCIGLLFTSGENYVKEEQ